MFRGKEIEKLVELLSGRGASLYHACQLLDFRSYLGAGGIPSRSYLESLQTDFTTFESDESDRKKGIWDKVFVNLSDFSSTYALGGPAVPNTYGPILLVMSPQALREASDVAVCYRSAGAEDFARDKESLPSLEDVNKLFLEPAEVGPPRSTWLKKSDDLRKIWPKATSPEINCTVADGKLPMDYVSMVRVDPYLIEGKPLRDRVEYWAHVYAEKFPVYDRDRIEPAREVVLNELVGILSNGVPSPDDLVTEASVSDALRDWLQRVLNRGLGYQFTRYANYLREGTILPILQGQV